jgi:hypothetical protein
LSIGPGEAREAGGKTHLFFPASWLPARKVWWRLLLFLKGVQCPAQAQSLLLASFRDRREINQLHELLSAHCFPPYNHI